MKKNQKRWVKAYSLSCVGVDMAAQEFVHRFVPLSGVLFEGDAVPPALMKDGEAKVSGKAAKEA
jgi:hypothetical protein